jgi:cell fate regulator YaaT (PSP1 superfamily)
LIYEYEQYVEARKHLPKRKKRVLTPQGEGIVIDTYPLRDIVVVRLDGEQRVQLEFEKDDLEPWDELEALRRKSEAPCDKHENGECDCGKNSGGKQSEHGNS